jgi:ribosomal protein S30
MDWCREDAAKENDGDRSVRMWKFNLLRFSLTNHTKYRILAFKLQAQLTALLPPKLAHELKYNRCVNHAAAQKYCTAYIFIPIIYYMNVFLVS